MLSYVKSNAPFGPINLLLHESRPSGPWLIFDVGRSKMNADHLSLSEIVGAWEQPGFESGLIERCRTAWSKPIGSLTNRELATCLRQKIAVEHLMPIARKRVAGGIDDGSEIDDGDLAAAVEYAAYCEKVEREDRRIRGLDV